MQPRGNLHSIAAMPAGLIDDQDDAFGRSHVECGCKFAHGCAPDGGSDSGQQQPKGLASLRTDKAIQVGPFVAMLHDDDWAVSFLTPYAPEDRFQTDTMRILSP